MYLVLIFPITGLLVAGYVTHYCASGSQGGMRTFGKILSGWVFLLAAILVVGLVTAPVFGGRPFGIAPMHHYRGWGPGGPGMMNGDNIGPGAPPEPSMMNGPPPEATPPAPPPPPAEPPAPAK
jgi:hypothetical protein